MQENEKERELMLELADLLATPDGRAFLRAHELFLCQQEFLAHLQAPSNALLSTWLQQDGSKLVYSAQEIYVDYPRSVIAKVLALASLPQDPDLFPFFLWLDTDRSGADLFSVRMNWPLQGEAGTIRVSPQACDEIETRFVALRALIVRRAIDRLGTHLSELPEPQKTRAKAK